MKSIIFEGETISEGDLVIIKPKDGRNYPDNWFWYCLVTEIDKRNIMGVYDTNISSFVKRIKFKDKRAEIGSYPRSDIKTAIKLSEEKLIEYAVMEML